MQMPYDNNINDKNSEHITATTANLAGINSHSLPNIENNINYSNLNNLVGGQDDGQNYQKVDI